VALTSSLTLGWLPCLPSALLEERCFPHPTCTALAGAGGPAHRRLVPPGLWGASVPPVTSALVSAEPLEQGGRRDAERVQLRAGVPSSSCMLTGRTDL